MMRDVLRVALDARALLERHRGRGAEVITLARGAYRIR